MKLLKKLNTINNFETLIILILLILVIQFKKTNYNTKINEIEKKITNHNYNKYISFLLGRMYFTRKDGFQNIFVYQPTFSTLKYKKHEC